MRSVWLSTVFLYSSDVGLVLFFIGGFWWALDRFASWLGRRVLPGVSGRDLRLFMRWCWLYMGVALVGFKFLVLQTPYRPLLSRGGAVGFSTVAEVVGGVLVSVGVVRWFRWLSVRAFRPVRLVDDSAA